MILKNYEPDEYQKSECEWITERKVKDWDLGVTYNSCTSTFILIVIWLVSMSHTDHSREEMKT